MTARDQQTWNIFANGYTQGINQCQSAATTAKLKQYKPRELRDLCAFVAAIRPGFKSQINNFLSRQYFKYDVPPFDMILRNDSSRSAWMLYQENTMSALNLAGFEMERTYPIIKAISKKKTKTIAAAKDEFMAGFQSYLTDKQGVSAHRAEEQAELVWKVIEDSASYSFNASHAGCVSLDAIYGAYLKAHHPHDYYYVLLEDYLRKGNKDKVSIIKQEMQAAFDMKVLPCQFRQDNRQFAIDKETNTVTDSLASLKGVSSRAAAKLYAWREKEYASFVHLLIDMDNDPAFNKTVIDTLIDVEYFAEFGTSGKLKKVYKEFRDGKHRYQKSHTDATKAKRIPMLVYIEQSLPEEPATIEQQVSKEIEYYGYPMSRSRDAYNDYAVAEIHEGKRTRVKLYNLRTGKFGEVFIPSAELALHPIKIGEILHVDGWNKKPAYGYSGGKRVKLPQHEVWLEKYSLK